ncbi:hypothetical protein G9A89_006286 [Geosiphon pyriformis]|nr:hypothetical protein G9A89_006286 [Geosiphon pyriformis]
MTGRADPKDWELSGGYTAHFGHCKEILLSISGFKISIAKKEIFFSMDDLSKPSLAKAHSDIRFFSNVPIIGYRLQFNCISKGVCKKWDKMLRNTLYHPELYGLRTFEQVLAENLLAGLAASWISQHSLKFPIKLLVNFVNCFLAGTTHALKLCNLSLGSNLPDVFWAGNSIAVLDVLSLESYLGIVKSLKRYGMVFKKLDFRGPVSVWFASLVKFIIESGLSNSVMLFLHSILVDSSCDFGYVGKCLLNFGLDSITVYTDGSIKNLGLLHACNSATAYFPNVNTSVGVKIDGLLLSTLVEIQAIALALEFDLYINSQALLDLCKSAGSMAGPDFHNKCWIEKKHIYHVIAKKGLLVTWNKVKDHSGVIKNERADFYANATVTSKSFLSIVVSYHFLVVEGRSVSGNAYHAKCVNSIISVGLGDHFDKARTFYDWHLDGRIRSGYTSTALVTLQLYFMKTFYYRLPMAKRKKMYNSNYLSVACI